MFCIKNPIPNDLKFFVVYKFTCASCSSSYIRETCRTFKTRIEEHLKKDNKSHIFKHLHSSDTCFDSYNSLCFKLIDQDNSKFDLKIKETLHINWRKPNLNAQTKSFSSNLFTIASVPLAPFFLFLFLFCCFLHFFSSIVFIITTLIIGTFYCLNYTWLLLCLSITHVGIDFIGTIRLTYVLGNYDDLYKCRWICTNQLTWKRSNYDWNASFEKCCNFYPNL